MVVHNGFDKLTGQLPFVEQPSTNVGVRHLHYLFLRPVKKHILFFDKHSMLRLLEDVGLVDIAVGYYGEFIQRLRKSMGLGAKIRRRLARLGGLDAQVADWGPAPSYMPPEMWAQVGGYEPCEEKASPARWLRVLARNPKDRLPG